MLTNADKDLKITPERRAKFEQEEAEQQAGEIVEKKIANTPTEGVGQKVMDMSEPGEMAVTYDQISDKSGEMFAPIIPIGYEYDLDNRLIWVLNPFQHSMVVQGKVCHACLEWQSDFPTMTCSWRGKHEGCGANRQQVDTTELFGRK